jgi:uncharacterized membrane protein
MSLESGPFLNMVTLGVAGLAAFQWPTLVGAILALLRDIAAHLDQITEKHYCGGLLWR